MKRNAVVIFALVVLFAASGSAAQKAKPNTMPVIDLMPVKSIPTEAGKPTMYAGMLWSGQTKDGFYEHRTFVAVYAMPDRVRIFLPKKWAAHPPRMMPKNLDVWVRNRPQPVTRLKELPFAVTKIGAFRHEDPPQDDIDALAEYDPKKPAMIGRAAQLVLPFAPAIVGAALGQPLWLTSVELAGGSANLVRSKLSSRETNRPAERFASAMNSQGAAITEHERQLDEQSASLAELKSQMQAREAQDKARDALIRTFQAEIAEKNKETAALVGAIEALQAQVRQLQQERVAQNH